MRTKLKTYGENRRCRYKDCKTILNIYSMGEYCHAHKYAVSEEKYLEKLLAERNRRLKKMKLIQLTKWMPFKKDLNGHIEPLKKYKVSFEIKENKKGLYAVFKKPELVTDPMEMESVAYGEHKTKKSALVSARK